jgi:hypothetical protein
MTNIHWHETAARSQMLARAAMSIFADPEQKPIALDQAQALMDHLWKMGFRPVPDEG